MELVRQRENGKREKTGVWKPFVKFYTRFRIPWWLFILSAIGSILYVELTLKLSEYTVMLKTGQLYNSTILCYAGITLAMAVLTIGYNMASAYGSGLVTLRARDKIWRKILCLPTSAFDREQPSSFVSRIVSDIPQASRTITDIFLFISSIYGFIRAFIILLQFNVTIALWLLIVIPLAIVDFWACGRTQYYAYKRIYAAINRMMTFFSEHLAAMKHCKAQTMEDEEVEIGYRAIEARFKADVFNAFMVSVQITLHSIFTKIAFLILAFSGKSLIDRGEMENTALAAGDTYLNNVQRYLAEILSQYQTIKAVQAVLGRVAELAETPIEEKLSLIPLGEEPSDIVLEHVSFGYNEQTEVLHDLSLTIPAGKKTAIVGSNGCGKSTLFKLLMRFYDPTSGTIYYGKEQAKDIHLDHWRTSFGYVLQNSPLLAGTIRENIIYGCTREVSEEELINAAKAANAYDFIMEFPEGFEKDVGEGGSRLSGGQRQRIAIARAIITNPRVLLMDEATASLDYLSDKLIWEAMQRVMEGRTTVLIAHDMSAVLSSDYIVVLNQGRVEAAGTHEALLQESPTYAEYVALQQKAGA